MNRVRSFVLILTLGLLLAACSTTVAPSADLGEAIPGQYIVVLSDDSLSSLSASDFETQVLSVAQSIGVQRGPSLRVIDGFVAQNVSAASLSTLRNDPRVAYVQQDRVVRLAPPPGKGPGGGDGGGGSTGQVVPWGITRIGAVGLANKGVNVSVFVVDSGIDSDHPDLSVVDGFAAVACKGRSCNTIWDDDNDHGTHVAGTIAALDNTTGVVGVAPAASLHAVKVLDSRGSGSFSGIIQGIDWVTAYSTSNPKVINMSLGGGGSEVGCGNGDAMQDAICAAVNAGITVVVAAGNSNDNAANHVPAAYDQVVTVSATGDRESDGDGVNDFFAYFTNWGADVDIAGPGYDVLSSIPGGGYASFNGTSMASPHVAGAAALYLSSNPNASPAQVQSALEAAATSTAGFANDSSGAHPEGMLNVSGF